MKFVAPMPEQIATTTMCPLANKRKALLRSQLVLAWVQRISNFWSSDDRLLGNFSFPASWLQYG